MHSLLSLSDSLFAIRLPVYAWFTACLSFCLPVYLDVRRLACMPVYMSVDQSKLSRGRLIVRLRACARACGYACACACAIGDNKYNYFKTYF